MGIASYALTEGPEVVDFHFLRMRGSKGSKVLRKLREFAANARDDVKIVGLTQLPPLPCPLDGPGKYSPK